MGLVKAVAVQLDDDDSICHAILTAYRIDRVATFDR